MKAKNVLVTGGNKRVGKAIALALAEAGFNIYITYGRDGKSAMETLAELKETGISAGAYALDLDDFGSVKKLASQIIDDHEQLYGLVNNAAIFFKTPPFDISESDYDKFMNTNLKGPFFLTRILGEHMFEKGEGRIVSIADVSAEKIWKNYIPYCLSKSGILAMTKGFSKAFAPRVLVNAVSPGTVLLAEEYDAEEENTLIRKTPLQRVGTPRDIARTVRFLMTENDFITGQVINVDGGRSIS